MKRFTKLLLIFILNFNIFLNKNDIYALNTNIKLPIDTSNMNIIEIQEKVEKGFLTYENLVKSYLDRINAYDVNYNTIISINKNALDEAKKLDKEVKKAGRRSLLHGIPIVIKDNIDYTLLPTTGGSKALKDAYPKKNAEIVQKLLDAGAIIIAKTNMSEFAFKASNSKSSYGHVYNAYNTNYTTYGSSGGTAAAVALNFAVAGIGTDTNSSVRLPASANNVIGFRPTYDSINMTGIMPYDIERDIAGPITKSVIDNAIILDIINNNEEKYLDVFNNSTMKNKRIGVLTQFIYSDNTSSIGTLYDSYEGIINLMEKAIDVFKNNGAEIINIDSFYSGYYDDLVNSTQTYNLFCNNFNKYIENSTSNIKNFQDLVNNGGYIQNLENYNKSCDLYSSNNEYLKNLSLKKKEYKDYVISIMDKYDVDVLIYPTTKNKLLKINESENSYVTGTSYTIAPTIGFPSINVQLGFDSFILPYGMEILSRANNEKTLYDIAYSYEKLTNFYKLPDEAKKLYEIPDSVTSLIDYVENNKISSSIKKEINDFFLNYNKLDTNDIGAEKLLNLIKNKQNNFKLIQTLYFVILSFIVLIVFIRINKVVKRKKRKKLLKKKLVKFRK